MGEEEITSTVLPQYDYEEEEEEEEALSLCNFPLDLNANNNKKSLLGKSSSEAGAPEFFEFLSDLRSDMCPADEIIFCGKLIPFQTRGNGNHNVVRKRSESLSELRSSSSSAMTRSNSCNRNTCTTSLLRNSRSLDYQKLRRSDNMSTRTVEKQPPAEFSSPKKGVKPRWYVFMFGMLKFPPEMELRDMKSRQFRRSPSAMFPTLEEEDGGKIFSGNRSSGAGGKGTCSSWNLLKALSCKDHTSVAVTSSFELPQV